MTNIIITNASGQHRCEAFIDGELAGFCDYNLLSDAIMFTHTEVLPAHEGHGVGSVLARHVLDDARVRGLHVIPVCEFIATYIRKHRDTADLVRPDIQRTFKI